MWENLAGVVCGRGAGEADDVDGWWFCCVGTGCIIISYRPRVSDKRRIIICSR